MLQSTTPGAFTAGLILVPTRELADQVHKVIESLTAFCAKDIQAIKLTDKVSDAVQRSLLSNSPDIVVSTPSRAWANISSSALSLEKLTHLVLDEADLVLSYGYEEDLQNVAKTLPKAVQTILMSATLTTEVDTLKGIFARNPVVLNLEEKDGEGEGVSQYVVKYAVLPSPPLWPASTLCTLSKHHARELTSRTDAPRRKNSYSYMSSSNLN